MSFPPNGFCLSVLREKNKVTDRKSGKRKKISFTAFSHCGGESCKQDSFSDGHYRKVQIQKIQQKEQKQEGWKAMPEVFHILSAQSHVKKDTDKEIIIKGQLPVLQAVWKKKGMHEGKADEAA